MTIARSLTFIVVAAAVAVPSGNAVAAGSSRPQHVATVKAQHGKPGEHGNHGKPAKPTKVRFHGTISAVDAAASSVSVTIRGGRDKALRGTTVTVTVPASAAVTRNDVDATLADLRVGDEVDVKGTRSGDALTVQRVAASGADSTRTPTPTETTPAPAPSETAPAPAPTQTTPAPTPTSTTA